MSGNPGRGRQLFVAALFMVVGTFLLRGFATSFFGERVSGIVISTHHHEALAPPVDGFEAADTWSLKVEYTVGATRTVSELHVREEVWNAIEARRGKGETVTVELATMPGGSKELAGSVPPLSGAAGIGALLLGMGVIGGAIAIARRR